MVNHIGQRRGRDETQVCTASLNTSCLGFEFLSELMQVPAAREARVRSYLEELRRNAKVEDKRREVNATLRRQVVE